MSLADKLLDISPAHNKRIEDKLPPELQTELVDMVESYWRLPKNKRPSQRQIVYMLNQTLPIKITRNSIVRILDTYKPSDVNDG